MFKISGFQKRDLEWWFTAEADIDFEPDFQRTGRVWKDKDRAFLIDSILNGYDIPKLYIADFTQRDIPVLNPRKKKYALIDGKQRLTAIFAFFRDRLPLHKSFVLLDQPTLALGKMRYSELKKKHGAIAKRFEKYELDVKAIATDDRKKVNDVFLRLNKAARALNGAEIRNAMIGRAVDSIRDIAKHRFFVQKVRFATDRSQDKNTAAKVLVTEYNGQLAETKKASLDAFVVNIGDQGGSRFNKTIARINKNLVMLAALFHDQDPLLGAQGHVPLYYLFISRLPEAKRRQVRAYLEDFESARVRNRRRDRIQNPRGDAELDNYDLASRSANDKAASDERLRILRKRFAAWLKRRRT